MVNSVGLSSPTSLEPSHLFCVGLGSEDALSLPLLADIVERAPVPYGKTCQIAGSLGCRLRYLGTDDGSAQDVGLELHQQVVARCSTIDLQFAQGDGCVALHSPHDIHRLESLRERLALCGQRWYLE